MKLAIPGDQGTVESGYSFFIHENANNMPHEDTIKRVLLIIQKNSGMDLLLIDTIL